MIRHLQFVCVLVVAPLLTQTQAQPQQATPPAQSSQPPAAVGSAPQTVQPPAPVAADAPVLTVHGVCPSGQTAPVDKSDSCTLVLTRVQFEALVSSLNVNNQAYAPPALRGFATNYATILALAKAAENVGVDKDPRFLDLMKIAPTRPQDRRPEFEKKDRQLAGEIRERAARGEDVTSLQGEVYKTLGLKTQPPQTELSISPKPTFPANVEQEINALKAGEVTKVEFEPSGFNIYKVRSRNTVPLELARALIVREISQKNIDDALKPATSGVTSDLNEQYFNLRHANPPPRIPARMVPPGSAKPTPPK